MSKLSGDENPSRRRRAERYGYRVRLNTKCSSWPKFVELFTGDVSLGGLFIPTDETAEVGEAIRLDLTLPNGTKFSMTGRVVNAITQEEAAKRGKPAGLGVALDELTGEVRRTFDKLIVNAKRSQPRPAEVLEDGSPLPQAPETPEVQPTGQVNSSAIHQLPEGSPVGPLVTPPPPPPPAPAEAKPPSSAPMGLLQGDAPLVGIDLGTSNTSVACVVANKVTIAEMPDGSRSMPSVVSIDREGRIIVGEEARQRIATDPTHTIASPKRLLGRKYDSPEIQRWLAQAPWPTSAAPDGSIVVKLWDREYAITQIVSYVFREAVELAERATGERITQAVVSVPVSFDEYRVDALRRAARMVQLEIVAVIDEPSGAALANRFDEGFGGVVGVYDFGGGTFDFSVVDVSKGDFQVLATAGDTWLGGDDFDRVLAEAAANQFWREHKVDLRKQQVEWQRLVLACELAKRSLSANETGIISVPDVLRTAQGMIGLHLTISRAILERACASLIQRSLATCGEALNSLNLKPSDLSAIYLSGGTTYIPAIRDAVRQHFQTPVRTGVPPEYAVCLGAAIHAAQVQFGARQTLDTR